MSAEKDRSRAFFVILIGQLVSILGTCLANFAIGMWVFEGTGSVTKFSMTLLAVTLPGILISPLAGVLVDRWNHRWTMILGDSVAAVCSAALAVLIYFKVTDLRVIVGIIAFASMVSVVHELAYTASIPQLVSKERLSRAMGIVQIGPAIAQVLSPALAGLLLSVTSVQSILAIDVTSFLFAAVTLFFVRVPSNRVKERDHGARGHWLQEAAAGWIYISNRQGLLGLLLLLTVFSFVLSMATVVLTPMLLTMWSIKVVGLLASTTGLGMLTGSAVLSVWGGPKVRINGVLAFGFFSSLCMMLMGIVSSPWLIAAAAFGLVFCAPIMNGCAETIWLCKTPPDLQGRVLSTKQIFELSVGPIAFLIAGPITDRILEPAMSAHGVYAGTVGRVLGVGPGRGMGLLIVILGMVSLLATLASFATSRVRRLERDLPDAGTLSQDEGDDRDQSKIAATTEYEGVSD
jgi:MFS family permease